MLHKMVHGPIRESVTWMITYCQRSLYPPHPLTRAQTPPSSWEAPPSPAPGRTCVPSLPVPLPRPACWWGRVAGGWWWDPAHRRVPPIHLPQATQCPLKCWSMWSIISTYSWYLVNTCFFSSHLFFNFYSWSN